ncbi:MAG: mechanosensitive ion channel [Candidatus Hatepunaea meridiana]|nr:mechanosensitive ion channel [Candidatus Hatepunaea meridiana]
MIDFKPIFDQGIAMLTLYAPKLLLAILTLIIGSWAIKILVKVLRKSMRSMDVDVSMRRFLLSIVSILLKVVLLISVMSMIGVQMTSFIAILGAAGLAVGLALQGSMSNFAGGVLITLFKPFKVGDVIEAQGYIGSVHEIQIFNTILKTPDNKTIVIPNGGLSNGSLTNYSSEPTRRVDLTIGIGYDDDIKKAKEVIDGLIEKDTRILKEPAPFIRVAELGDSSVNFAVRVWCNSADYWNIFFDLTEQIKLAFDTNGISIPFPQSDVHVYKHTT